MKKTIRSFLLLGGLAGSLWPTLAAAAPTLEEARGLLAAGRAAEAYERLVPEEFTRAGEVEFDYLFGLAALEAGRAGQATLAFERVLAVDPAYAAARLDMGRAYYALGDLDRAQQEFAAVRALEPPTAAIATIDNYEKAIAARRDPRRLRLTGYVEVGAGGDSNVNQSTGQSSIQIPAFGGTYSLGSSSLARRDDYTNYAAGAEAQLALDERLSVYAAADLQLRDYGKLDAYDVSSADLRGGVLLADGKNLYRLAAGFNDYRLESDRYRGVRSAQGEWRRALDQGTALSLSAQYMQVRYVSESQQGNDVNVALLGAGVSKLIPGTRRLQVEAGAFAGNEREERERTDGNRVLGGLRVGAQLAAHQSLDVFASVAAQAGLYSRYNALFEVRRRDAQYDLGLGASWRFAPLWSLRPQLLWTRVDSNMSIYDTSRYDVSLSLRRDFR